MRRLQGFLPAPCGENGLGVTIRLFAPLEDEVAGSAICNAVLEVRAHRLIAVITGILIVHHCSHAP